MNSTEIRAKANNLIRQATFWSETDKTAHNGEHKRRNKKRNARGHKPDSHGNKPANGSKRIFATPPSIARSRSSSSSSSSSCSSLSTSTSCSPSRSAPAPQPTPAAKLDRDSHPSEHASTSDTAPAHDLLHRHDIWRARELHQRSAHLADGIDTGFKTLNDELVEGGWPSAGLVEFLSDVPGIGELRLLGPALKRLSRSEERWLAWIHPPFVPYAPALEAMGVDSSKILLIHPKSHQEALWACEQSLRSGTCSTVLAWFDETQLSFTELRRLQLAAKQGRTWANLFRPVSSATSASPAELRLKLRRRYSPLCNRLDVDILKRKGSWSMDDIHLELADAPIRYAREALDAQLTTWRQSKTVPAPADTATIRASHAAPAYAI